MTKREALTIIQAAAPEEWSARDGQEERFEELAGRHEQVMRQVEATRAMIQASRVSL